MNTLLMLGAIGSPEIVVIGVIVLILFGAGKVKEFSRSVGQSVGEFKGGLKEGERVAREATSDSDPPDEEEAPDEAATAAPPPAPDERDYPPD